MWNLGWFMPQITSQLRKSHVKVCIASISEAYKSMSSRQFLFCVSTTRALFHQYTHKQVNQSCWVTELPYLGKHVSGTLGYLER